MIYALVEPSIYMIASILPTTRHLYRRIHRRARELRSSGHDSEPKNSNPGAQLERMDADERGNGEHVDTRQTQTTTTSSQEELTHSGWQQKQQAWKQRRPEKKAEKAEKKAKPAKSGGFKGHDVSTMDSLGS